MNVKKIAIRPDKIGINLVLCPKTNLYLQDLFCRRCGYYESDGENSVQCNFSGHRYGQSDPTRDKLIKDLSNRFITELPIEKKTIPVPKFSEQLKSATPVKSDKEAIKQDLSKYMKTSNLKVRLDSIKKKSAKESDSVT